MSDSVWKVLHLPVLLERVDGDEPYYLEYLRMPGLSSGVYQLPADAKDMQPRFDLICAGAANHSFFDIEENLTLLAFVGPIRPAYV